MDRQAEEYSSRSMTGSIQGVTADASWPLDKQQKQISPATYGSGSEGSEESAAACDVRAARPNAALTRINHAAGGDGKLQHMLPRDGAGDGHGEMSGESPAQPPVSHRMYPI